MSTTSRHDPKNRLIDLFPLHPKKLLEEEHNMAACIFSSCDGAATTLTGILCSDEEEDGVQQEQQNTNNVPSPSSVELVRTAMRRNEKGDHHYRINDDHEKWVCYSEVVERKMKTEIVSSSSSTSYHHYKENNEDNEDYDHNDRRRKKLVLKLDYEKVIESWVDKGPLFIHSNSDVDAPESQTVPDLQDDDIFFPSYINANTNDEQDNGGMWLVPEIKHIESYHRSRGDDPLQVGESSAMAHNREASVQRYKEKRRNRLYSKTVRYEVRKLNAEKRPRLKGRFVKSTRSK
ncbi:hypothetical protein SSX86_016125 [Deinandra increscens subsp. villosa]|uniref:CCT domain-containing protein n=1 Tax=Deinandra increscens subsp. villosa TaxID=3103831 RepID=A0AAP0D1M3_9ASTR